MAESPPFLVAGLVHICALADTEIELPTEIKLYTPELVVSLLQNRVDVLNIDLAKQDVRRFIYDEKELDIWSQDFFSSLTKMIKFK